MIKRLFLEHPHSVGETYLQHLKQAMGFGVTMVRAGCACLVHAVVPAMYVHAGSSTVARLHACMGRRAQLAAARDLAGGEPLKMPAEGHQAISR
jgi:hypothetical protein